LALTPSQLRDTTLSEVSRLHHPGIRQATAP